MFISSNDLILLLISNSYFMKQICKITGKPFVITSQEEELCKKMGVPLPVLHPKERIRVKMAFRNERVLYKRKCDFSGEDIISIFPEDVKFPVYKQSIWESENWTPPELPYDPNKDFLKQFQELFFKTPQPNLVLVFNENCNYVNWVDRSRNCYLITASSNCEDCYYSNLLVNCQDCFESINLFNSQLCLECVDSANLYNCNYVISSRNLVDCSFCVACFSCQNCLGCYNLRNKKYCIFNNQYSKEEYERLIKSYHLSSFSKLQAFLGKFEEIVKSASFKAMDLQNCENCTGHHLKNCRNSIDCYDSNDIEDCVHVIYGSKIKDCSNSYAIVNNSELCHEVFSCFNSYNSHFGVGIWNCENTDYSIFCRNSTNLFGCIGLKKRSYSILNKQYSKEDYFILKEKIINDLNNKKIYGSFFPLSFSPFPYNNTVANDYYPLSEGAVRQLGGFWSNKDVKTQGGVVSQQKIISIPDDIEDVSDNICSQVLICQKTGKSYRIIPQELAFYRKKGFPVPRFCFDVRHQRRLKFTQPWELHDGNCAKCGIVITTPYREANILCEKCYNDEI